MSEALGFVTLFVGFAIVLTVGVRNRALAAPLTVGFLIRAALAVVDVLVRTLPGHPDSVVFDMHATYWARNGVAGTLEHLATGAHLYTWVLSVMYAALERSQLMAQGVNVLFGTLVVLNVAKLTRILGGDEKLVRQAAWLTAIFPSLNYYSAVLLREVAVTYPLSLAVLNLAKWYRERKTWQMVAAVLALLVSMAFHSGSVAVLLAAGIWLIGAWGRSLFTSGFRNLGRNSAALVAGIAAVLFVFSSGFGMGKFKRVESGDIDDVSQSQTSFARGRTAYLADMHPETGTDLVVQTPLRLVYFLFAPFPWMLNTGSDLVGIIDSFFFFFLFFRIWRQRAVFSQRKDALLVLAVFGAMALTFAVGVSNYGTALRHRAKMLPLLIGVALSVPWKRSRTVRSPASSRAPAPRT